ncbi:MAG TPA: WG repeat-containing protein [Bacteroidales bacterium]|nr:WG repeat-containing protein [Bacteroidales bacterium]HRZ49053.1 WG repeat-containing protein [Bacteroidales bacterium]
MKTNCVRAILISVFVVAAFQGFLMAQTAKMVLVPYKNEKLNLYGFKDSLSGKIVVAPRYDHAGRFVEGLSKVIIEEKYGFADKTGKLVLPCKYYYIDDVTDGMAVLKTVEGKYGYCNNKGVVTIPPKYSFAGDFGNGLAPVESGEKCGYINKTGQFVIPPKFDWASSFNDGYAIVTAGGKQGLIDKTGKYILPLREDEITYFSKEVYKVRNSDRNTCGLMDKSGKWLTDSNLAYIGDLNFDFPDGISSISDFNDQMGIVNGKGEVLMPPSFDSWKKIGHPDLICVYTNYDLWVTERTRFGLYDLKQKKLVTELVYNEIDDKYMEGMLAFAKDGKVGYFDSTGKVAIEPLFDKGYQFNHGVAVVQNEGKYMLINSEGKIISDAYDHIFSYSDDLFMVNNSGTWSEEEGIQGGVCGLIRYDGTVFAKLAFAKLDAVHGDMIIFLKNNSLGFMDLKGNEVMKPDYTYLGAFNDGLAFFRIPEMDEYGEYIEGPGTWGYINKSGKEVIPATYDDAFDFSEGLGQVILYNAIIFIDTLGKEVLRLTDAQEAGPFSDGMAWVKKDGKIGYTDRTGVMRIPCIYEKGQDFSDGVTKVELQGNEILINKKGEEIRRWKK